MVKNTNKKGLTIIEVVLVLAIAGLIFLMVFIALPALQRSQRNTQRENDISRFLTATNDYRTNNSNNTPFQTGRACAAGCDIDEEAFVLKYILGGNANDTGKFTDPNGTPYDFVVADNPADAVGTETNLQNGGQDLEGITAVDNHIYTYTHSRCTGNEGVIVRTSGEGDTALVYVMEGGAIYCTSN